MTVADSRHRPATGNDHSKGTWSTGLRVGGRRSLSIVALTTLGLTIAFGSTCTQGDVHGLNPNIQVDPEEISFGTVTIGMLTEETLFVRNVGGATLHVESVVMQGGASSPFAVEEYAGSIVPDGEVQLMVTFEPDDLGPAEDLILIASDDPDEPEVQVPVYVLDVIEGDDDTTPTADDDDTTSDDDDTTGDDDDTTGGEPQPGDYGFWWTGAAPETYDHTTGGGAYNDGTVGASNDILNSLPGYYYACGDIVTFLLACSVDPKATVGQVTWEADILFETEPSGDEGVGYIDVTNVEVNYGVVENGAGAGGTDAGMIDDGGSTATILDEYYIPVGTYPFAGASDVYLIFEVDDIETNEQVIIRFDALLACNPGDTPSGTIRAEIIDARITEAWGSPLGTEVDLSLGILAVPMEYLDQIDGI